MITSQLESLATASKELSVSRTLSRTESVKAMRDLEEALVDALGEERLRGLPNLNPGGEPFFGLRVRGKSFEPLPDSRNVLCIDDSGMLVVATSGEAWTAHNVDLLSEDLEPFVKLVAKAIDAHIVKANKATHNYKRCMRLAHLLRQVLETSHETDGA
jgi:hypothetical protein